VVLSVLSVVQEGVEMQESEPGLRIGCFYSGEMNIACPHCGFDYTHIESLLAFCSDRVEIEFSCEGCEQHFAFVIQFHEGISMLRHRKNIRQPQM
jgi:hypothetical protein